VESRPLAVVGAIVILLIYQGYTLFDRWRGVALDREELQSR